MINIIKTAIITIVISFISGLLLDYYKNLAPRILCNIGKGTPLEMDGKKIFAYVINVINVSNKTIHNLTLNIQSAQSNLKVTDEKITKGLKFDSSIEDNILDVSIPFLSKNDKFSVMVYAENQSEVQHKPIVVIRSPEKFKRIDSAGQNGMLAVLFSIPQNIKQVILKEKTVDNRNDFTTVIDKPSYGKKSIDEKNRAYDNRKLNGGKKAIIVALPIILVLFVGFLGKSYFKGVTSNSKSSAANNVVSNQSADTVNSTNDLNKNSSTKKSSEYYKTTNSAAEKNNKNAATGSSTRKTLENKSTGTEAGSSYENRSSSSEPSNSTENKGTSSSAENSSATNSSTSTGSSSSGNTAANSSSGTSSDSKGSSVSINSSTGSSSSSTENKDSSSGTNTSTGNAAN